MVAQDALNQSTLQVRLDVINGTMAGQSFIIDKKMTVTIGRSPKNDFCLPDDQCIGRNHARITIENKCFIEDMKSTNGTWVNGNKITQKTLVEFGGVFVIGDTTIKVTLLPTEIPKKLPVPVDLNKQIEQLQKENAKLRQDIEKLQQRMGSTQSMDRNILEYLLEKDKAESIDNHEMRVLYSLYQFALKAEGFIIALVHSLTVKVDSTGISKLPSHPMRLQGLMSQLLKENNIESAEKITKYLKDLNKWLISVITGYEEAVPLWCNNLWEKIAPKKIENISGKKKSFELPEVRAWNQYKEAVSGLHPNLIQDEIREMSAKFMKECFKDLQ
ncbi:MAG: FHA domain-containing protein [bacterium]